MLEAIRRAISFLRQKQILHKLGVAVSVTVIGIACYVLYHMLRHIDVDEVIEAIKETEPRQIALAALFVAAGYFTLTFYDLFAVRAIGRADIPYRINALAAFTSYSIGHNVGASVFTGGAVRYRIYSAWGLNAIDVAKICFLAGLTFWLGNAAVLGLGIAYHPEAAAAIDQLPPWLNRLVALLHHPRRWWPMWSGSGSSREGSAAGPGRWMLPGGPLTLLQIAIGIVDLGFCALAMYVLVPDEPNLGFVVVAVIFVSATLLGFASHSPGGLGVFDAAMLVGLWQMDREDLLAGMLLFRVLYYLAPFVISVILLTFREVILGARIKRLRQAAQGLEAGPAPRSRLCARARRHRRLTMTDPNGERAGPMAIDAPSSSSFFSPWPDRLRHSAIILLAAGLALAVLVAFGELSPLRAAAVFCLHRRGRAGAVAAAQCRRLARGRPRRQPGRNRGRQRRRRRHAGSGGAARPRRPRHPPQCRRGPARAGAAQERTRPVRAALAGNHHRAARSHRHHRNPARDLSRSRAGRSLDGTDHHAGAGADAVRRHRQMHADDVPRPDAAAPGRGNARRLRRQCQP